MRDVAQRRVKLKLLGGCRLVVDGDLVQGVPANFFRIAAFLILSNEDGAQPRHRLSSLLWSESDGAKAAANMRQALARIRHLQEEHNFRFIEATFSTLYLPLDGSVDCDLIELADCLSGARSVTPVQMCSLYGGELLVDLDPGGDGLEDWLSNRRDQLASDAISAIAAGIQPDSKLSMAERATCARRLLEIDPYREEAVRILMREAAEHRHLPKLNRLYGAICEVLSEDLGVRPQEETRALYDTLLQSLKAP